MAVADEAPLQALATATTLAGGLDGIRRGLEPPGPLAGLIYELPEDEQGAPLPDSLPEALAALHADETLCAAMGHELVDTFTVLKEYELARFRRRVTDWELREYMHHL